MRKILTLFILIGVIAGFTACGDVNGDTKYTVTFESDGGSDVQTQSVLAGAMAAEPAVPTRTGFEFVHWVNAANDAVWDFNTPVTENITLKAVWIQIFTVTFDLDGGSIEPAAQPQEVRDGSMATKPANDPTKTGWHFYNWVNAANNAVWNFDAPITSNMTIKAAWLEIFTVTFDLNEGEGVAPPQQVIDGNTATQPEAPTRTDYYFLNWVNAANDTMWSFSTPVTGNIVLKATWTEIPVFEVTFNPANGSSTWTQNVPEGNAVEEPAKPTREGYNFVDWFRGDSLTPWDFDVIITEDITLTARWTIMEFTVTFDTDGGEPMWPSTQILSWGQNIPEPETPSKNTTPTGFDEIQPTAVPGAGHYNLVFVHWINAADDAVWNFNTPLTSDITLKAVWREPTPSVVTFDNRGGIGGPQFAFTFRLGHWVGNSNNGGIPFDFFEGVMLPAVLDGYTLTGYEDADGKLYFFAEEAYPGEWWLTFVGAFDVTGPDTYFWPIEGPITLYARWENGDK